MSISSISECEHRMRFVSSSGHIFGTATDLETSSENKTFFRAYRMIDAAISLGSASRKQAADLAITMSDRVRASVVSAFDSSCLSD